MIEALAMPADVCIVSMRAENKRGAQKMIFLAFSYRLEGNHGGTNFRYVRPRSEGRKKNYEDSTPGDHLPYHEGVGRGDK